MMTLRKTMAILVAWVVVAVEAWAGTTNSIFDPRDYTSIDLGGGNSDLNVVEGTAVSINTRTGSGTLPTITIGGILLVAPEIDFSGGMVSAKGGNGTASGGGGRVAAYAYARGRGITGLLPGTINVSRGTGTYNGGNGTFRYSGDEQEPELEWPWPPPVGTVLWVR